MKLEFTIPRRVFNSLKHVASKDETRPLLCGFNLRSLNGFCVLTACNGTNLVSVQLAPSHEKFDFTLPFYIPAGIGKNKECFIEIEDGNVTYHEPGFKVVRRLVDGQYPDFVKAVPALAAHTGELCFNISRLKLILDAALAYQPKGETFISPNEKDAAVVAIHNSPEWFGLLMPLRNMNRIETPKWLFPQ